MQLSLLFTMVSYVKIFNYSYFNWFISIKGHGGAKIAQYSAQHLHRKIVLHPLYQKGNIEEAIRLAFLELDSDMLTDENMRDELAGTTAIIVLIKDNKIYCVIWSI